MDPEEIERDRQRMAALRAEARARGIAWARSIAERRPELVGQPFPPNRERTFRIVYEKIRNLDLDPRVRDELAGDCYEAAENAWRTLAPS